MADAGETMKYTLDYYMSINFDDSEPPFKYRTNYLADALTEAYCIKTGGGHPVRITQGNTDVFGREALSGVMARISAHEREQPGRAARMLIEEIIRESGM